ncbi:hypothetical protein [Streptomyces sp. NPDC096068]|uniref:hypothetical protein n=1 Tax=Streptomyces sp. NPDC096068 TaxID=3155424 RepID=UPI0033165F0B
MLRLSTLAVTTALLLGIAPAQAMDGPEELTVMPNEQYEEMLSSQGWPTAPRGATPRTDRAEVAPAAPGWATVKFNSKDRRGKAVPTRIGNNELGWKHFSGPHNITDPDVVKKIIGGTANPVITAYCRNVPRNRCPDRVNQT